jgi:pimeloyl-ACP methyl ester carboxylesterase
VDDLMRYDVPAILDYVRRDTGHDRVNWVGHSMGGMLMFPYFELEPTSHDRIANFVAIGSTITLAEAPQRDMLWANRAMRGLSLFASPGRLGRPLTYFRMPGMGVIDSFYYSDDNVDERTVSRFYGYTLEDPGPGAFRQLDVYLRTGHMLSADGRSDYSALLGRVMVSTLMVAGEGDIISDVPSSEMTFRALGSRDKTLMIFGRSHGQVADYGHCDLVWSRHAPREIFPRIIDWLDQHQPGGPVSSRQTLAPPGH